MPKELLHQIENYINKHYIPENETLLSGVLCLFATASVCEVQKKHSCNNEKPHRSLDDVTLELDETFSERLLRLIDLRELKDSDVYKKVDIDRRLFSKIRGDKDYSPSKKTVILFIIALELSLDDAKDLLLKAGYALSHSNKFDLVIEYFLQNENYNLFEINEALFHFCQTNLYKIQS